MFTSGIDIPRGVINIFSAEEVENGALNGHSSRFGEDHPDLERAHSEIKEWAELEGISLEFVTGTLIYVD